MSEEYDNYFYDGDDPDLQELKPEEREEIKRQSMENTYTLITNNYNFEVFPNKLFWLLSDFDEITVFDVLIDYFKHPDREQYEKCAVLVEIVKDHKQYYKRGAAKKGMFTYQLGANEEEDGEESTY